MPQQLDPQYMKIMELIDQAASAVHDALRASKEAGLETTRDHLVFALRELRVADISVPVSKEAPGA